jgi:hypothetical protein
VPQDLQGGDGDGGRLLLAAAQHVGVDVSDIKSKVAAAAVRRSACLWVLPYCALTQGEPYAALPKPVSWRCCMACLLPTTSSPSLRPVRALTRACFA